MFIASVSN